MTLVNGQGQIVECSESVNPDILNVGRVSVGALGVISEYTLQAVPSFRLRALEQPMRLDDVLENIHQLAAAHDHFEFFWIPHTKWALTKRNNRTDDELEPLPKVKGWIEKTFMENYAFGALLQPCHRLAPGNMWIKVSRFLLVHESFVSMRWSTRYLSKLLRLL